MGKRCNALQSPTDRIVFLDASRGLLACVVVVQHVLEAFSLGFLAEYTHLAVVAFFVISGFVLARSYDGRPFIYVARRIMRLWPLYFMCILVGCWLGGVPLSWHDFFAWPLPVYPNLPPADPPAWSLYYELWLAPISPLLFAVCARSRVTVLALSAGCSSLAFTLHNPLLDCIPAFLLGIALNSFQPSFTATVPKLALWLGKVSFSLYLTHGLVLLFAMKIGGPWLVAGVLPLVLPVAWLSWRLIEQPSENCSRALARIQLPSAKRSPDPPIIAVKTSPSSTFHV